MIRGFFLTSDLLHRLLSQQNLRRRRPSQHNLQKIHELRWVNLPQVVWPIPLMLQLIRLWTTNRRHRAQSSIWKRTTTPHRVMLIKNKTMEKNQSKWKIVFVMIFQRWLQVLYRQGSLQQLIHLHCGRFLTPKNMRGFRCLLPSRKTPMVVIHFWVQLHVTKILLTSKVGCSRTSKSKWPMLRFFKKHWPVKSGKTMLHSGPVVTTRMPWRQRTTRISQSIHQMLIQRWKFLNGLDLCRSLPNMTNWQAVDQLLDSSTTSKMPCHAIFMTFPTLWTSIALSFQIVTCASLCWKRFPLMQSSSRHGSKTRTMVITYHSPG